MLLGNGQNIVIDNWQVTLQLTQNEKHARGMWDR